MGQSALEALLALKEATSAGLEVKLDSSDVVLPSGKRFARSAPTAYKSSRGAGQEYTMDALWSVASFGEKPFRDYVKECESAGVARVQIVDQRDLVAYLKGKASTGPGLSHVTAADVAAASQQAKDGGDAPALGDASSRGDAVDPAQRKDDNSVLGKRGAPETSGRRESRGAGDKEGGVKGMEFVRFERSQRSRDSVFTVQGRSFKSVLEKLQEHMERNRKQQARMDLVAAAGKSVDGSAAKYDPRGDRYKVTEDTVWKERLGTDFGGIDTAGSFKRTAEQAKERERQLQEAKSRAAQAKNEGGKGPPVDAAPTVSDRRPIVILPPGYNVFVGIHNAIPLLFEGNFVEEKSARDRTDSGSRVTSTVQAKRSSNLVRRTSAAAATYLLTNNPARLTDSEWKRVVGVIVSGMKWQFKAFTKWRGDPVETLRSLPGFYFHYDDDRQALDAMRDWRVIPMPISRNNRHLDQHVAIKFWQKLDEHIARRHPTLNY